MNTPLVCTLIFLPTLTLIQLPVFAQETSPTPNPATRSLVAPAAQPSEAEMMKQMIELARPGANQKVLAGLAGNWTYTVKMWMNPDPKAPPIETTGTAVRKMVMGGRYLIGEYSGKMKMPGADGKMKESDFKGMGIDGYDNVKKKFVASWIDNAGTGIMEMQGDYDQATDSVTYTGEEEMMPGMKTKVRQVVKIVDKDHGLMEWYEDRGGKEVKTMEIAYTRKK